MGSEMCIRDRYWLVDPAKRQFDLQILSNGRYEPVEADDGRFHSTVIPGLVVDPAALFDGLD